MVAQNTVRTYRVNQVFRLVEGTRKSLQIRFFSVKYYFTSYHFFVEIGKFLGKERKFKQKLFNNMYRRKRNNKDLQSFLNREGGESPLPHSLTSPLRFMLLQTTFCFRVRCNKWFVMSNYFSQIKSFINCTKFIKSSEESFFFLFLCLLSVVCFHACLFICLPVFLLVNYFAPVYSLSLLY